MSALRLKPKGARHTARRKERMPDGRFSKAALISACDYLTWLAATSASRTRGWLSPLCLFVAVLALLLGSGILPAWLCLSALRDPWTRGWFRLFTWLVLCGSLAWGGWILWALLPRFT
jgi:hypothetical protein